MPSTLISFYDIGPSSDSLATSGATIGAKLDYAWNPYYGTYSAPSIPGMTKDSLSPAAVDIKNTSSAVAAVLATRTVMDGYGVFMTYNLSAGDHSAYVTSFTRPLYGQSAVYR
jgi:hypothetical protein